MSVCIFCFLLNPFLVYFKLTLYTVDSLQRLHFPSSLPFSYGLPRNLSIFSRLPPLYIHFPSCTPLLPLPLTPFPHNLTLTPSPHNLTLTPSPHNLTFTVTLTLTPSSHTLSTHPSHPSLTPSPSHPLLHSPVTPF